MQEQKIKRLLSSELGNRFGYFLAAAAFLYVLFSLIVYAVPSLQPWHRLAFAPIRLVAMAPLPSLTLRCSPTALAVMAA